MTFAQVGEKVSLLPALNSWDVAATDAVVVLDKSDTTSAHAGPGGDLKGVPASGLVFADANADFPFPIDSSLLLWSGTHTFTTGGPIEAFSTPGTWTFGAGSDLIGTRVIRVDPTIIIDTTVNLLYGEVRPFLNSTTLQSQTNSTARNLQDMQGFRDAPLVQGNTSADTMFMVHSHVAAPRIGAINNGSLLLDNLLCFSAFGQAFDGGTITNRTGLYVADVEKVGTGVITNQYGVDIDRFANASTKNVGIRNNSRVDLWDDTVTFTVNPDNVVNVSGTWTLGSGTDLPPRVLDITATLVVNTALNAFAVPTIFRNALTYKSDSGATARDLKDMRSFYDQPTIQADGSADTMVNFSSFLSSPAFNTTGGGTHTLALTDLSQFDARGPAVGTGVTITTTRGLRVGNPSGAGTVTNAYGLDVESITKGGTKNRAIRLGTGRGIEWSAQDSGNDTTTTLPASAMACYVKGNNLCFAYNDAGTMRFLYIPLTGTGVTWTHSTTGP